MSPSKGKCLPSHVGRGGEGKGEERGRGGRGKEVENCMILGKGEN